MLALTPEAVAYMNESLNQCYSPNIRAHFPFPEVRPAQETMFRAFERAYRENKKFIICEAPTGSGKSGVAIAAASFAKTYSKAGFLPGAYILSPQKTLTKQYMDDFRKRGLLELKGKANYTCVTYHDEDTGKTLNCEDGMVLCTAAKKKMKQELDPEYKVAAAALCPHCPYKEAKQAFIDNPLDTTNFAYYLAETDNAGELENRNLLILDEGHNTESLILNQTGFDIDQRMADRVGLTSPIPEFKETETPKAVRWIAETFIPAVTIKIDNLAQEMNDDSLNQKEFIRLTKRQKRLVSMRQRLQEFVDAPEVTRDWLAWTDLTRGSATYGALKIKPLSVAGFANDMLFSKADKVLIMSATILDFATFMRSLGIDRKDAVCVQIDSDFPLNKRPIYYRPVGSMSSTLVKCPICNGAKCPECQNRGKVKSIDITLPLMADKVSEIFSHKNYANRKGITFTHSFKITKFLLEHLTPEARARIITHEQGAQGERDLAVVTHYESPNPTVLFSPSMTEGLDLKGERSRFSIIVKVPFAPLDPYNFARKERDPDWYAWLTALAMVQATGRSNRDKEDWAHHFILDAAFRPFFNKYEYMFPKYWSNAINWPR